MIRIHENQREQIYEKSHNAEEHESFIFDEKKVKIASDINKVIDENERNVHVIYALEDGEVNDLFAFNKLMIDKKISWREEIFITMGRVH